MLEHHVLEQFYRIIFDRQDRPFSALQNNIKHFLLNSIACILKKRACCFPRFKYTTADDCMQGKSSHNKAIVMFDRKVSRFDTKQDNIAASSCRENCIVDGRIKPGHLK